VAHEGSREGYRDIELFIATMEDPAIIDRLQIAITGTGAFRRFKDGKPAGNGTVIRHAE
jgi:hypothetical protein